MARALAPQAFRRLLVVASCTLIGAAQGAVAVLHDFAGPAADGSSPLGDLLVVGGQLFGLTSEGGSANGGTVFRVNPDGTGYSLLQSLDLLSTPVGSLVAGGSTLYGTTSSGGTNGGGSLFRLDTTGGSFQELWSFGNSLTDSTSPVGTLVLAGSTLYGMTQFGGTGGSGTIFKIGTNGSGFEILHNFTGGAADGSQPFGSLNLLDNVLYGTTANGGALGAGTVFRFDLGTSTFGLLHSFADDGSEGINPQGALTASGSTLYGTTTAGGAIGAGTVFRIGTDGTGFTTLHEFTTGAADGSLPSGAVTVVGSQLYGTTRYGGASDNGTVFAMGLDGQNFQIVHAFSGATDGAVPQGSLVQVNNSLYGLTSEGGAGNYGTIFAVAVVPEPGTLALLGLAGFGGLLFRRGRRQP